MNAFRERIRVSLANEALQAALDANAERRVEGRLAAFESLPDWRERRARAHAVRADVIAHLDHYLDQFTSNARANGFVVHRSKNAKEAINSVLEIIGNTKGEKQNNISVHLRSSLVAKSKSMVSEEIELNHALEAAGHRVVETDLGEYIVQLRGEKPAHIITPAVHLRRHEVGRLFTEKLGIPYTEDVSALTQAARKVLRTVFLSADVGISGVNFGVAETGALCIVTNEGNGRMVTTLPRVHIALMGMERLVPDLDDLALMLSLLARSATAQKLSVYTQLINRPLDGQSRHLILLDNGRRALRASPLAESLYCIRCGACLNACPVFREIGGHGYVGSDGSPAPYPGPIGSVVSPGLLGANFVPLAQASSLCGACKDACPVDIDLPKLLTRVRAGQIPKAKNEKQKISVLTLTGTGQRSSASLSSHSKFLLRMYSRVARRPVLFAVSQRLAALGAHLVSPFGGWIRLPAFTGWGYSKDFPRFAARPFRKRFKREDAKNAKIQKQKTKGESPRPRALETNKIEQFTQELTAVGGRVISIHAGDLTRKIIDFLKSRDVTHIHLEPEILDEVALHRAGITPSHAPDPGIRVGVTKAVCGLADTGSVLIADGHGSPLHASLLPEVHIAVLRAAQILPSLENALSLPSVRAAGAAVVITGPSRTADIEMTLTIGVHGPAELHVFLIDDKKTG